MTNVRARIPKSNPPGARKISSRRGGRRRYSGRRERERTRAGAIRTIGPGAEVKAMVCARSLSLAGTANWQDTHEVAQLGRRRGRGGTHTAPDLKRLLGRGGAECARQSGE